MISAYVHLHCLSKWFIGDFVEGVQGELEGFEQELGEVQRRMEEAVKGDHRHEYAEIVKAAFELKEKIDRSLLVDVYKTHKVNREFERLVFGTQLGQREDREDSVRDTGSRQEEMGRCARVYGYS